MPVTKSCVICGEEFSAAPSTMKRYQTCRKPECKKAVRSGANNPMYGRDMTGEKNPFFGKSHTEESKAKNRDAHKKQCQNVVCACGCGAALSIPAYRSKTNLTGLFFLDSAHLHDWLKGGNHWNFKGGSHPYGVDWSRISKAVRGRDKVCQMCGKTAEENGRALDVHHKNPFRMSLDNSMENLIALCMLCHRKVTVLEDIQYAEVKSLPRPCVNCKEMFVPSRGSRRTCSDECSKECQNRAHKKYQEKQQEQQGEAYQRRRDRIKKWQQDNKDRVNASHALSRQRQKEAKTA